MKAWNAEENCFQWLKIINKNGKRKFVEDWRGLVESGAGERNEKENMKRNWNIRLLGLLSKHNRVTTLIHFRDRSSFEGLLKG